MSNNDSIKSAESISEENIFTSHTTQNKSQKISNIKTETKDNNNLSHHNSEDEELIRNKLLICANETENFSAHKMNSNDINTTTKKTNLGFILSPIKKGIKKKNLLFDIMEKSKKKNGQKRTSVIFQTHELKLKDEEIKNERKDVYGVPINKRNKKKIKVTFSDTVNSNISKNGKNGKNQLAEVIPIASYKKYNYIEGLPKEEDMANNKSTCQCCIII